MLIDYSIVSIGTENSGSTGYMFVTEISKQGKRDICPLPHFSKEIIEIEDIDCLSINGELSIEKIAMIRFQLITLLALKK